MTVPFIPSMNSPFVVGYPGDTALPKYYAKILYSEPDYSAYYYKYIVFDFLPQELPIVLTVPQTPVVNSLVSSPFG